MAYRASPADLVHFCERNDRNPGRGDMCLEPDRRLAVEVEIKHDEIRFLGDRFRDPVIAVVGLGGAESLAPEVVGVPFRGVSAMDDQDVQRWIDPFGAHMKARMAPSYGRNPQTVCAVLYTTGSDRLPPGRVPSRDKLTLCFRGPGAE